MSDIMTGIVDDTSSFTQTLLRGVSRVFDPNDSVGKLLQKNYCFRYGGVKCTVSLYYLRRQSRVNEGDGRGANEQVNSIPAFFPC